MKPVLRLSCQAPRGGAACAPLLVASSFGFSLKHRPPRPFSYMSLPPMKKVFPPYMNEVSFHFFPDVHSSPSFSNFPELRLKPTILRRGSHLYLFLIFLIGGLFPLSPFLPTQVMGEIHPPEPWRIK